MADRYELLPSNRAALEAALARNEITQEEAERRQVQGTPIRDILNCRSRKLGATAVELTYKGTSYGTFAYDTLEIILNETEARAKRLGLQGVDVRIQGGTKPSAGALYDSRVVFINTGNLTVLDANQCAEIMTHELGHLRAPKAPNCYVAPDKSACLAKLRQGELNADDIVPMVGNPTVYASALRRLGAWEEAQRGFLNAVSEAVWGPGESTHPPTNYRAQRMEDKARARGH